MTYPTPDENIHCHCRGNPMAAFWCQTGHMLECHFPYSCQAAACSHLQRYDFGPDDIAELEAAARANITAGLMPEYNLDEAGNVVVASKREMFERYARVIVKEQGRAGLEAAFAEAGFERSEVDGVVTFTHPDDPEAVVTMRYVDEEE